MPLHTIETFETFSAIATIDTFTTIDTITTIETFRCLHHRRRILALRPSFSAPSLAAGWRSRRSGPVFAAQGYWIGGTDGHSTDTTSTPPPTYCWDGKWKAPKYAP